MRAGARFFVALMTVLVAGWSIFWYGHFTGRKAGLLNNMVDQRAVLAYLGPASGQQPDLERCLGRIQATRDITKMSLELNEYITNAGVLEFSFAPLWEPLHYLGAGQVAAREKLRRPMCPPGESMACRCEAE